MVDLGQAGDISSRPLGEHRWQAVQEGDLRAVSVGFRPINWDIIDKVLHYKEAKLKEVSTCPIGANDNALLVSAYVAGQFERLAAASDDAGRLDELMALVEELRADLDTFRTESTRGGDLAPDAIRRATELAKTVTA